MTTPEGDRAIAEAEADAKVETRRDRAMFAVVIATGIVCVVLLVLAGAVLLITADSSGDIDAQARSDEITGCRASYSSELVSGPQAQALKALAEYGVDSGEFRAATAQIDPGEFQRLARLSTTDPDKFLALCRNPKTRPQPADPVDPEAAVYLSCGAAELAGAAPLRPGDPGWNPDLDADGDGVACE